MNWCYSSPRLFCNYCCQISALRRRWVSSSQSILLFSHHNSRVDKYRCLARYSPRAEANNAFFHHYQGSIDFNTVNIHRTVGMYFLVSTGNRGDIEWHDLQRSYYPIHSLLPGVYVSILSLGTVFPRTLPMANIRNTSSRGKHWQCSSNDADKLNVDICRQAKRHYIGCTIWTKLKQYKQKIIQIVLM